VGAGVPGAGLDTHAASAEGLISLRAITWLEPTKPGESLLRLALTGGQDTERSAEVVREPSSPLGSGLRVALLTSAFALVWLAAASSAGAYTVRCNDGTYSDAGGRPGACSHHAGVAGGGGGGGGGGGVTNPPPTYQPYPLFDDHNCSDFSTQDAAQAYYNLNPSDPSRLDADHDGKPCENLPSASGIVRPACDDELDNDGDGLTDLFDPDCHNSSAGKSEATPPPSPCSIARRKRDRLKRAVRRARRMVSRSHGPRKARYRRVLRHRRNQLTSARKSAAAACYKPPPAKPVEPPAPITPAATAPAAPAVTPPVPTPPVPAPSAIPQSLSTNEDTPLAVTLTGTVAPGRPITFIQTGAAANGMQRNFDAALAESVRRIEAEQREQKQELKKLRQQRITHLVKHLFDRQSERMTRLDRELQDLRKETKRPSDN
jgi:hypothetical protein